MNSPQKSQQHTPAAALWRTSPSVCNAAERLTFRASKHHDEFALTDPWADSVVEDAAPADGRELVAVPDERDPGADFVGDGEERPGGLLVEHPGHVDHEQVPGSKGCRLAGPGVGLPGPVPVVVPAETVRRQ